MKIKVLPSIFRNVLDELLLFRLTWSVRKIAPIRGVTLCDLKDGSTHEVIIPKGTKLERSRKVFVKNGHIGYFPLVVQDPALKDQMYSISALTIMNPQVFREIY